MKKYLVTTLCYDGSNKLVSNTEEIEARSEEQIYKDMIFQHYIDLVYCYVRLADEDEAVCFEDKFYAVERAVVYTIFAETDCPYGYIGKEIRRIEDMNVFQRYIEIIHQYQSPVFVRRATDKEQLQWVESMRDFACN